MSKKNNTELFSKRGKDTDAIVNKGKGGVLDVMHTKESHKLVTARNRDFPEEGAKILRFSKTISLDIREGDSLNASLAPRTWKIIDIINADFAAQNARRDISHINRTVEVNLLQYAKLLGYNVNSKRGRAVGRREVLQHIEFIASMKIFQTLYNSQTKTERTDWMSIIDAGGFEREGGTIKNVRVTISQTYAETQIMLGYIMPLPRALFAIDDKHQYAYAVGRSLCYFNHIKKNLKAGRENFISVKTLLEICRSLPTFDELNHRDWRGRIIKPFARTLNVLKEGGVLNNWRLCSKDRKELGNNELDFCSKEQFLEYYILFELAHTAPREERLIELEEKEKSRKPRGVARKPRGTARAKKV